MITKLRRGDSNEKITIDFKNLIKFDILRTGL